MPSSGWGAFWVGLPDRGYGTEQPGGWVYNILPFIEEGALHDLGKGKSESQMLADSAVRLKTPISALTCPTRRSPQPLRIADNTDHMRNPKGAASVTQVARAGYGINSGSTPGVGAIFGPDSIESAAAYEWPPRRVYNGISYIRSKVRIRQIKDGTTKTLLIGEKYLPKEHYFDGEHAGDNESMYNGFCLDLNRHAAEDIPPAADSEDGRPPISFGGPHDAVWLAAFCDGSVHPMGFDIDPILHAQNGNKADGTVAINPQ